MQITSEKYSPSIILNCARYLGSKFPPNNFQALNPRHEVMSGRSGKLRKTIPEIAVIGARSGARVSGRPHWKIKKNVFTICVDFLVVL